MTVILTGHELMSTGHTAASLMSLPLRQRKQLVAGILRCRADRLSQDRALAIETNSQTASDLNLVFVSN